MVIVNFEQISHLFLVLLSLTFVSWKETRRTKVLEQHQHPSVFVGCFERSFTNKEIGVQHTFKVNNDGRKASIEPELNINWLIHQLT